MIENRYFRPALLALCLFAFVPGLPGRAPALEKLGRARPVNEPRVKPPLRKPVLPPRVEAPESATNQPPSEPQIPPLIHPIAESSLGGETLGQLRALCLRVQAIDQFKNTGKVTTLDIQRLREAITNSCNLVFPPMNRPDGGRIQVLKYGDNVILRPEVMQELNGTNWTPETAQEWTAAFGRLLQVQGVLSTQTLAAETRKLLQNEHLELLNRFFIRYTPPQKPTPPPPPKKPDDD